MALPAAIPVLAGTTVVLRPFEAADAALVRSVADDPLVPLITTVPTSGTEADARAYLERQHLRLATGAGYSFAIAVDGRAVGQIGLWTAAIADGRASTGYWVAAQHRRRGHLTDALRTLATWAVGLPEVTRLELFVEPWNTGSWRAAETCGFEREGLLRHWQRVGGEPRDMYAYSLLPGGPDRRSETG